MDTIDAVSTVNFTRTSDGTLRVAGTRVSLDSIFHHFSLGSTAEEIVHKFPSLELSAVYATIAYILQNRKKVEHYIRQQRKAERVVSQEVKQLFGKRSAEMRERILARNNGRLKLTG